MPTKALPPLFQLLAHSSLLFSALFHATISYEKSSPVPYPFNIRDYEHYANADILPWESRQYDTSLHQCNCHGNPVRYELYVCSESIADEMEHLLSSRVTAFVCVQMAE